MSLSPITHDSHASGGVFRLSSGGETAQISYSRSSPQLVIAASTVVPDGLRGQGVGLTLLKAMIADARASQYKIVALCPFVRAQMQRHPEWHDVLQP